MKYTVFLQARMGSTRTPGKVLLKIQGQSIISLITERLKRLPELERIVLVTSRNPENLALVDEAKRLGIDYFTGSEENMLDRFYEACQKFQPECLIRVTGDCPVVDPKVIAQGVAVMEKGAADIVGNTWERTYPDGFDFEIFTPELLKRAWQRERNVFTSEAEFQAKFFNPVRAMLADSDVRKQSVLHAENLVQYRVTLDYPEDFTVIKEVYDALYPVDPAFGLAEVMTFLKSRPDLVALNKSYVCTSYL